MTHNQKMICPHCGVEMNHHCDKLVYTTESHGAAPADLSLGVVIEEFHACPSCGTGNSRKA
jgi:hypothetical protein